MRLQAVLPIALLLHVTACASTPREPAPPSTGRSRVQELLLLPDDDITAAAEVGERFCAEFESERAGESGADFLSRVSPLITAELHDRIEKSVSNQDFIIERRLHPDTTTAQAKATSLRSIDRDKLLFTVHIERRIDGAKPISRDYAVWMTRPPELNRWRVSDVELAENANGSLWIAD